MQDARRGGWQAENAEFARCFCWVLLGILLDSQRCGSTVSIATFYGLDD
jgi:hypothetical protein